MGVPSDVGGGDLDPAAIRAFRSRLRGALIEPTDAAYGTARLVANAARDRRPALILRAAESGDIVRALEFADHCSLPLAIRSGGHSVPGYGAADGALVIDLSAMRRLGIDPKAAIARVQPGMTAGEYAGRTHAFGLATTFGDNGAVGIGGLTLGGGIGFLARRDGLTIDQLLAAEMVAVDGRRVTASAGEHPDLFWALRGGGGNFGVVTEFTFAMRPAGMIYGGWLILPATHEVVRGAVAAAIEAPDALTAITNVMLLPALPGVPPERVGELAVVITAVHSGDPNRPASAVADGFSAAELHAAETAFQPFRSLAQPIVDRLRLRAFPEMFGFFNEVPVPPRRGSTRRNTFLDRVDDDLTDAILDFTARPPSLVGTAQLRVLGGAVSRVPADATAYAHRDRQMLLMLYTDWEAGSDSTPNHEWIGQFWAAAGPHGSGAYVGFLGGAPSGLHSAYPPATYARLAAVKRAWDPTNRLRLNHNVQPADGPGPTPAPGSTAGRPADGASD